ncbi:MAG TPA: hypothetical protein VNW72_09185 [Chthoniobacterales bacterium]|jgi:hypothetical protein|nr:hypothetical protein [Chthoniobacterales bacterium]
MALRNVARQILGTFMAVFAGWLAAVVFVALEMVVYLIVDPHTKPRAVYWYPMGFGIVMSFWIIPVWLVVLIPLYLFVPTSSVLWRKSVCAACGAIAGIILAYPFFHPMWGVDETDFSVWNYFILAAIVGGVTCFVGALTRNRFKPAN